MPVRTAPVLLAGGPVPSHVALPVWCGSQHGNATSGGSHPHFRSASKDAGRTRTERGSRNRSRLTQEKCQTKVIGMHPWRKFPGQVSGKCVPTPGLEPPLAALPVCANGSGPAERGPMGPLLTREIPRHGRNARPASISRFVANSLLHAPHAPWIKECVRGRVGKGVAGRSTPSVRIKARIVSPGVLPRAQRFRRPFPGTWSGPRAACLLTGAAKKLARPCIARRRSVIPLVRLRPG